MKTWVKVWGAIFLALFALVWTASAFGWWLPNDDADAARARSIRSGSLHSRPYSSWNSYSSGK